MADQGVLVELPLLNMLLVLVIGQRAIKLDGVGDVTSVKDQGGIHRGDDFSTKLLKVFASLWPELGEVDVAHLQEIHKVLIVSTWRGSPSFIWREKKRREEEEGERKEGGKTITRMRNKDEREQMDERKNSERSNNDG